MPTKFVNGIGAFYSKYNINHKLALDRNMEKEKEILI